MELHIYSDFSFQTSHTIPLPYKKHEKKSRNGCKNKRMFEHIIIIKNR